MTGATLAVVGGGGPTIGLGGTAAAGGGTGLALLRISGLFCTCADSPFEVAGSLLAGGSGPFSNGSTGLVTGGGGLVAGNG